MKLKHLLVLAAVAVGGSAMAQTDVTSTYLVNPSFELKAEGEASTAAGLSKTGGQYYGWNLPNLGSDYSNVSIGSSSACDGNGYGVPSAASDGSYYFFNRKGWGTQAGEISQTTTLPAGKYYITVDYKAYERSTTNGTIGFSINGTSIFSTKPFYAAGANTGAWAKDDPWKTIGAWFTVENESEVKIAITENLVGGTARADLYLDNVKLYKWELDDEVNYNNASTEKPLDVTNLVKNPYFDNNVNDWTTTTGYQNKGRATNQGGAISGGFFENWNASAKESGKMSQTVTGLKDGLYRLTAAVFNNNANANVSLFIGDSKTPIKGNSNEVSTVIGSVEGGSVEIGLELGTGNAANWIGLDNVKLEYLGNASDPELEIAKSKLQNYITEVALKLPTANIEGQSESLIVWSEESIYAMITALAYAQDALDNSNSVDEVNAQIENLEDLELETVATLIEGEPYNIIMAKEGLAWSGKAVTFTYNESNQNNYAMAYSEVAGESNYNQAVSFDIIKSGEYSGNYIMFTIDAEDKMWYLTDGIHVGSTVGWATEQLRMTDNANDAMPIDIIPSLDKEGVCELVCAWTGIHIGSTNNNGFYCSNDNYDLSIQPAAEKTITVNTSYQYATAIIPGTIKKPANVTLYTVTSTEGDALVLTKEEGEYASANVPYIVESEDDEVEFTCLAVGYKSEYTEGLLTGVYGDTKAPVGSYVLQMQDKLGFYKVASNDIAVNANRCYLTEEASGAKAFHFPANDATAIKAIDALTSGNAGIYTTDGVKVNSLQKGINIIKTADGKTQKVLVK